MMTLPMIQTLHKRAKEEEKYYKCKDGRAVLPAHSRGPDGHGPNISVAIGQADSPSGRRVPEAGTARVFDPSNFEMREGQNFPKSTGKDDFLDSLEDISG